MSGRPLGPSKPTPEWVRRRSARRFGLTPIEHGTLLCLWDHVARDGTSNWSQSQIADQIGCGDRAIRDALVHLKSLGLISVHSSPVGHPVAYLLTKSMPS